MPTPDPVVLSLAAELAACLPQGRPLLVAVDGRGGSGKSTFARQLAAALQAAGVEPVTVVPVDGYVLNEREEDWMPLPGRPDVRVPHRVDVERLAREVLQPLRAGRSGHYRGCEWWEPTSVEEFIVPPLGAVIVEGCYGLTAGLRELYDARFFFDCFAEESLARALARDVPESPDAEVAELVWRLVHVPAETRYIEAHNPRQAADWIVACPPLHSASNDAWLPFTLTQQTKTDHS